MHTELASGYAQSIADFPLRGLLVCATLGCGQQLYPAPPSGEPRAYRNACGCRMRPLDAAVIEGRVFAQVIDRLPALARTDPALRHAVYRRMLIEVTVGGTVEDVRLVWRT